MIEPLLTAAIPLLLATMGGLVSERAGILNISLEGLMLSSAFFTIYIFQISSSLILGLMGGIFISLFMTALFILGSVILKGDPFVTGLGINLMAYPLTSTLSKLFFHTEGTIRLDHFAGIDGFFFPVLMLVIVIFTVYLLEYSPFGLIIKLSGGQSGRLREKGINPDRVKIYSLLYCAVLVGLSGAALSLNLGVFVPGMSAGKGWIALVSVYLGGRRIRGIIPAVLFFTLFEYLSVSLQRFEQLPADLMLAVPYFLTLILLLVYKIGQKEK